MNKRYLVVDQSLEWLIDEADSASLKRGQIYFFQNRVTRIEFDGETIRGTVRGTRNYNIKIEAEAEIASCDCPAEYPCKHLLAAVYAISAHKRQERQKKTASLMSQSVSDYRQEACELVLAADASMKFRLMKRSAEGNLLTVNPDHDLLKFSGGEFIEPQVMVKYRGFLFLPLAPNSIESNSLLNFLRRFYIDGKPLRFAGYIAPKQRLMKYPPSEEISFDKASRQNHADKPAAEIFFPERFYIETFFIHPENRSEQILLPVLSNPYGPLPPVLIPVLNTPAGDNIADNAKVGAETEIPPSLNMPNDTETATEKNPGDQFPYQNPYENIQSYKYFFLKFKSSYQEYLFNYYRGSGMALSATDLLAQHERLKAAGVANLKKMLPRIFSFGPVATLSLFPEEGKRLRIRGVWKFNYASSQKILENDDLFLKAFSGKNPEKYLAQFEITNRRYRDLYNQRAQYEQSESGNHVLTNPESEKKYFNIMMDSAFYNGKKGGMTLSPNTTREFLLAGVKKLRNHGIKIQIHKSLTRILSEQSIISVGFKMNSESSGIDWFGGSIEAGGMTLRELREALKAYRKKEDFVRLPDGNWISLEMIGLKKLMDSIEMLGIKIRQDGTARQMTRGEALAIERELDTRTDSAITALSEKIDRLPEIRRNIPEHLETSFNGTLRDYQKTGIIFLESLYDAGLGGILADDMGLGKTIQGLAFLDRLGKRKTKKGEAWLALVVGPLASLSVWRKEAEKHFPGMPVTLWHGTGRAKSEFPKDGILLTTYGTLMRDFEGWKNRYHFDVALLDEAQNLKNFRSLSSHAVRQTSVSAYFCLTGTPLENHLLDLWSLFDICFPGYLGHRKGFIKTYTGFDTSLLRRKIEPFVLRRTKALVLNELPPLTETLVPVAMTEKQRRLYDEARKKALYELASAKQDYLMVMLPHLTRLRRIACHPEAGSAENADIEASGKFQYLKESLEELQITSSGILIFSQFTDILKICAALLDSMKYGYFYLDGKTPAKKREQMVHRFQEGEKDFFLISLKAGGTALTLHRADTVIHLDPWWNPAAERQASDRAHRIGQQKKVFVYKLYSEKSIEEKVLELQQQKKEIFDAIFGENLQQGGNISRQQILNLLSD